MRKVRAALWLLTSLAIVLIMIVSFGDVLMRTFARPISGAYEVTEIAVGAMIFAALPVVTLQREHVTVTLLSALAARITWLRLVLIVVGRGTSAVVFAYLGYRLWLLGSEFDANGASAIFAGFPLAPFAWFAAIMCWLSCIATLLPTPQDAQVQEH